MAKIPTPRLLPSTIAAMAALLLVKSAVLLRTAVSHGTKPDIVIVAAANAASTDMIREGGPKEASKPREASAPPTQKAAAPPPTVPSASPAPAAAAPPPVSDSEKIILQELRQRRLDLDTRASAIATRESVLVATEQKLAARVTELQALQKKLEGLDAAQKQKEEAGWQGLVKLYETMKPRDAATILNDLSMNVLLQILDRMKDAKAAAIMAAMNPEKARDVTGELAQMRTGHNASGAPVAGIKNNLSGG